MTTKLSTHRKRREFGRDDYLCSLSLRLVRHDSDLVPIAFAISCSILVITRATSSDDSRCHRLISEIRDGTVTYGIYRDSALPVRLFALGAEALSSRASGHDDRICGLRFSAFSVLASVSERPTREVDLRHRLGDDTRAESQRSGAELLHQLRSKPPPLFGEAREI